MGVSLRSVKRPTLSKRTGPAGTTVIWEHRRTHAIVFAPSGPDIARNGTAMRGRTARDALALAAIDIAGR